MATIIGSKVRDDNKIVFEVCLAQEEALQLKGVVDNLVIIPPSLQNEPITIAKRGANEATMYFLIPKKYREDLKNSKNANLQKIDLAHKSIYVYTVRK